MNDFARPIFADRQHGLAKQVLNIAIVELKGGEVLKVDDGGSYFCIASNFELTIELSEAFNEENAKIYFKSLA